MTCWRAASADRGNAKKRARAVPLTSREIRRKKVGFWSGGAEIYRPVSDADASGRNTIPPIGVPTLAGMVPETAQGVTLTPSDASWATTTGKSAAKNDKIISPFRAVVGIRIDVPDMGLQLTVGDSCPPAVEASRRVRKGRFVVGLERTTGAPSALKRSPIGAAWRAMATTPSPLPWFHSATAQPRQRDDLVCGLPLFFAVLSKVQRASRGCLAAVFDRRPVRL